MKKNTAHISLGKKGEEVAAGFLSKKGFKIIERNVNRKWGELDIVALHKKTKWMHVVEVKTVSGSVASAQTRPIENLTKHKVEKLERTATLYMKEKKIDDWQLDAVFVWFDEENGLAQIQHIEKIY